MIEADSNIAVRIGSERSFGVVFCCIFLLISLWPLMSGGTLRMWAMLIALAFLFVTILRPKLLTTPNYFWFKFGLLLGAIVAPVVMGLVYAITVVPVGLLMRSFSKDPLHRKFEVEKSTYWVKRTEPMQPLNRQF